ncbi:MAG TPA: tetratricopeptide repeat protein [Pyrinomonadaceae bacterium]|nr:tetratricopeptide repeat protein [Pyrinomonadaceae bacterium]
MVRVKPLENKTKHLNESAQALMQEERWDEVINLIEPHQQLHKEDAELSWNLGWCYFKLQDWKTAQLHLSRARDLNPKSAAAWWALGAAQMEAGVLEEAERNVKESLLMRDSTIFRQTLAFILMKRKKLAEAEQVHLSGLDLKPDSPERWESYAIFLEDMGRHTEAQIAFKNAYLFRGA